MTIYFLTPAGPGGGTPAGGRVGKEDALKYYCFSHVSVDDRTVCRRRLVTNEQLKK